MKKRILTLAVVLTMLMAVAIPAAAQNTLATYVDEMNDVFGEDLFTADNEPVSISDAQEIFLALGSDQSDILTGDGVLSRVMAAQAVWSLAQSLGVSLPEGTSPETFTDTDDSAVGTLAALGIMTGVTAGTFNPDGDFLNVHFAVVLHRLFSLPAIGGLEAAKTLLADDSGEQPEEPEESEEPEEPEESEEPDEETPDEPDPLEGAHVSSRPELEIAMEIGFVPESMIGNWGQSTSRLLAAEMIVMLIEAMTGKSIEEVAEENDFDMSIPFGDTDNRAATFLKASRISYGAGSSEIYNPNGTYNRAEMVTMLGRMAENVFGYDLSDYRLGTDVFDDVGDFSWANRYIGWAADTRITLGVNAQTFAPRGPLENQYTVMFTVRAFQNLIDE